MICCKISFNHSNNDCILTMKLKRDCFLIRLEVDCFLRWERDILLARRLELVCFLTMWVLSLSDHSNAIAFWQWDTSFIASWDHVSVIVLWSWVRYWFLWELKRDCFLTIKHQLNFFLAMDIDCFQTMKLEIDCLLTIRTRLLSDNRIEIAFRPWDSSTFAFQPCEC